MGRKRAAPRLWLDQRPGRGWCILDGGEFIRTGCAESDRAGAEKKLAEYLGDKYKPQPSEDPLIVDTLLAYGREHLANKRSAKNAAYNIQSLSQWWGAKAVSDINPANCKSYAATKSASAARRDLEVLRGAVNYWHRFKAPLPVIPPVILPDKPEPRDNWLTRDEWAKVLWQARRTPHLGRFILLGIYTGSRSGVLLKLEWSWIDLKHGVMARRAPRTAEIRNKRTPKVRLGKRIMAHLRRWYRLDGKHRRFVCHYNGQRIIKLRRSWIGAVKRAKVQATPHTLRHSRATWLMQKGVDPWKAAGHLGMTVDTLLRTYGHHHPDYQKEAAEI